MFQYDALNRLTQANGSYGTKSYQYDQIGNIVQKDGKICSYGGSGGGIHAVTSLSDGTTFTYDPNGNMATKQKGPDLYNYIYDTENRLVQLKKNNVVTASYEYDGDGGRVKKTIGSTVTKYVGSLYEETNGVRTRHIFIDDMKIASITNAQIMYYHGDHLGGTNVLTDKLGVKKELMEYEPFGSFARHDKYGTGAEVAQFYFTGQRFDEESGLYYYGARYYDPSLGRFITADSIVQSPSDGQTFNRYAYCGNNPVNNIDPSGHSWFSKVFKAVGQFISNLVNHPIQTLAATATAAIGIFTGNPFLIASGIAQYVNFGTSSWQGGGWNTFHQIAGYGSAALALAGAFYSPASPPSAELGYNSAGDYVGTVDLGTIIVTKTPATVRAAQLTQLGNQISGIVSVVQGGLTAAGMIPGIGEGFDLANAGISAARGDWVGAGLGLASAIPLVGNIASAGNFGRVVNFSERQIQKKFKHASDFGINGNYNKSNIESFQNALNMHVNDLNTVHINGTFKKTIDVNFYVNPDTGLNVITDVYGNNFISGFRLNADQLKNVLTRGQL